MVIYSSVCHTKQYPRTNSAGTDTFGVSVVETRILNTNDMYKISILC